MKFAPLRGIFTKPVMKNRVNFFDPTTPLGARYGKTYKMGQESRVANQQLGPKPTTALR